MSGEVIAATVAGVGTAGLALVFDQNLALASAGGVAMMLAVSATIPLQTKTFFAFGSYVLGYIVGVLMMRHEGFGAYGPLMALITSGLGSTIFGSLHGWFSGGPTPKWISFVAKFIPFSVKKGGPE